MCDSDLPAVCELDRIAFGADRSFFLKRRFIWYPELSKVMVRKGVITGYIFGRRGNQLISFGPWFVQSDEERPEALLEDAAIETGGVPIGLGVLETNNRAVETIRSLGLQPRTDPPWRMALGRWDRLGMSERLFAVGSAATG
jgi:hypothetical protein